MTMKLVALALLTALVSGIPNQEFVKEERPELFSVLNEPTKGWPPGNCVVAYVDAPKKRIFVMVPHDMSLRPWGWVPMNEAFIGKVISNTPNYKANNIQMRRQLRGIVQ